MALDLGRLERRLRDEFSATDGQARVVARQAADLADSARYERDVGAALTTDVVIEELGDAPGGTAPARWNWWIGSLELAFGGYAQFSVRRYGT